MNQLARIRAEIRRKLSKSGTDVKKNDDDPFGDGDQSPLRGRSSREQQIYRDLFAEGGDFEASMLAGDVPGFPFGCVVGKVDLVKQYLEKETTDDPHPSKGLIELLEKRQTAMRMSPLLLLVAIGKNVPAADSFDQIEVAKLLLQYGARPDAKDVCGKTVCHYGAGCMATKMTLKVAEMCIAASQSSHFFGKEVELFGLKNESMNGKRGIGRGFHTDTGRRSVYIFDEKNQVAVKPENIRLCRKEGNSQTPIPLYDVQDRLGSVCLQEVLMANRLDVAKFLLEKHTASIDIEDYDGFSPKKMVFSNNGSGKFAAPDVSALIEKVAKRKVKAEPKACAKCQAVETVGQMFQTCARCKSVYYCSKECQKAHWKRGGHKEACVDACAESSKSIDLEKPISTDMFCSLMSFSNPTAATEPARDKDTYKKPPNVAFNEKFYVKIQEAGPQSAMIIYDETRKLIFRYEPNQRGFREIREKVLAATAYNGRKTYMKASFSEKGVCTLYLGETSMKKW